MEVQFPMSVDPTVDGAAVGPGGFIGQIDELRAAAIAAVDGVTTLDELKGIRGQHLGKKSPMGGLKSQMASLEPDARKAAGQALNEANREVIQVFAEAEATLTETARRERLEAERLDLTEVRNDARRGHLNLVTQARYRLEDVFVAMGYQVAEGPEVETAWYNFEALNIPDWHPARGEFDTIFVNLGEPEEVMLRSHTSPVQIRTMESQEPPIYIVAPGRTFRSDSADATHLPAFNQIEGLVVDRGITMADLAGTIDAFIKAFFGSEVNTRLRPSYFPFTEPSAEFDITMADGSWLELGGCGMVNPQVLANCGIDPDEWQGFAFGFGIDRLAVMRYGLDDIRELVNNDVRFLRQF